MDRCDQPYRARGFCSTHWNSWRRRNDASKTTPRGEPLRWLKKYSSHSAEECLKWPFRSVQDGRGIVLFQGQLWSASRLMCKLAHGDPPSPKHEAAHSCGRAHDGCVNPKHLRWATKGENEADKVLHGTSNRGIRNGSAKLSESDVLGITLRLDRRETQQAIADDLGIAQSVVSAINRGEIWGWLTKRSRTNA